MKALAATVIPVLLIVGLTVHAQTTRTGGKPMFPPQDVRTVAPALEKYAQGRLLGEVWKRPGLSRATGASSRWPS